MKKLNSAIALQRQLKKLQNEHVNADKAFIRELNRANDLAGKLENMQREYNWLRQSHDKLTEAMVAGAREGIFPRRNISNGR